MLIVSRRRFKDRLRFRGHHGNTVRLASIWSKVHLWGNHSVHTRRNDSVENQTKDHKNTTQKHRPTNRLTTDIKLKRTTATGANENAA